MNSNKTITLCGSTTFYQDMDTIQEQLELLGFNVLHPRYTAADYDPSLESLHLNESHKKDITKTGRQAKYKLMVSHMEAIKKSDAILVLNLEKSGKENYIGGNTFLEMGFAFAFDKKIFVYNELPTYSSFYDELSGLLPTILYGELKKIQL